MDVTLKEGERKYNDLKLPDYLDLLTTIYIHFKPHGLILKKFFTTLIIFKLYIYNSVPFSFALVCYEWPLVWKQGAYRSDIKDMTQILEQLPISPIKPSQRRNFACTNKYRRNVHNLSTFWLNYIIKYFWDLSVFFLITLKLTNKSLGGLIFTSIFTTKLQIKQFIYYIQYLSFLNLVRYILLEYNIVILR